MPPKLTAILTDAPTRRAQIHQRAVEGLEKVFPLKAGKYTVELKNIQVQPRDFSSREQKDAILQGGTLQEPVHGDILLRHEDGRVIDQKKGVTLAQLPYFTQRHTFIVDGNEYSVSNQRRIRPGVYTRVRANEELEAAFNLSHGDNFRVNMDPAKGHMFLQYGATNIPLYPILKNLGVPEKDIVQHWGAGVVDANKEHFERRGEAAVGKLYEKLVPPYAQTATSLDDKAQAIKAQYALTRLDPEVTTRTLGAPFAQVTPGALLKASQKLLDVHRQGVDTDDRDSLAYQTLHTVDDFFKERIQLEGRNLAKKIRMKIGGAGAEPTLARVMPASPFSRTLRSFLTSSSLSSTPTQINPMEIIDGAVRITNLGEGGISSERAVPNEARNLHHTHLAVLDPARTPGSFRAGIDLRAALWTKKDEQGRMYTLLKDSKTGKIRDVSVDELEHSTIAFPGATHSNAVSALRNGQLVSVPHKEIDYELPHPSFMFSPATNTVPMPESLQGNRIMMGGLHSTGALPLVHREAPYVQVGSHNPGRSFEQEFADLIVPTAPVSGTIHKVDADYIYIKPHPPGKTAELYHGSPQRFETLMPRTDHGDPRVPPAVFATPDYNFSLAYLGKKWGDRDINQAIRWGSNPRMILQEMRPGALEDIYGGQTGYLHHVPEEPFEALEGRRTRVEVVSKKPVTPYKIEEIPDVLEVLKRTPKIELVKYDPKLRTTQTAVKRQVSRMLEMKPEDQEGYKKWRLEVAPPEMRKMFEEEHERQRNFTPLTKTSEVIFDNEGFEKTGEALIKIPYDHNFPLASKTYLHNNVTVKAGDDVVKGQHLADSNFTKDGTLALGKNLKVGYMAYYGINSNDAVVVSETGSQKLTSEHMYKEALPVDDDTFLHRDTHQAHFGNRWTADQYKNLDSKGVIKPGMIIQPGDPLVLALRKTVPTAEQKMLGRLHKSLATPYREDVVTWDHRSPGEIIDVVHTPTRVLMTVKTQESAGVGDKVSGRFGNKGVIAKIIPDDQMVQTKDGKPLDLLITSAGVVSRINPAQIIETAVGKVAEKTGKPIIIPSMSGRNNVKWAKALLKEHGLTDKEVLYNPVTGKDLTGMDGKGVMVGRQYIYKLYKSTETNYSARGIEDYDVNLQPAKGGDTGAKALGRMEINGLLAHDARNTLREASTLKSSRNDEWWRRYQLGQPLPPMKSSFAFDKFTNMLQGAGVKVDKSGDHFILGPMTDKDTMKLSSGVIQKPLMVREKDFSPEKGGLFDPIVTGGSSGDRWGHIELAEPIVNPVFEDPIRRFLGLTKKDFDATIKNDGAHAIRKKLIQINLDDHEKDLEAQAKTATEAKLDGVIKQLKTVRALKAADLRPEDAYIISKIPVVPPVIRPILPSRGKRDMLIADANYLYRDAMLANNMLDMAKKNLPPDEIAKARAHLYDTTKAVFGLGDPVSPQLQARGAKGFINAIAGQGSPKAGFFHAKVLKKPQDLSGRGTVVPDLNLNMDEVGLPEDMMWTMYGPHIVRGLVQKGYRAMEAKDMVENQHPAARDVLMMEAKQRPVIVNRAPTLHRFGIVGAYAVPVTGKTIRVNPFLEKGMNMDYDGDCTDCDLDTEQGGRYTRIHISQFPHVETRMKKENNKESYQVPPGIRVFSYDEKTGGIVLKPVTGFSIHHNLEMVEVTYTSGRVVKVSRDASLFALNPETWQLERVTAEGAVGWAAPRPRILFRDTISTELGEEAGWFFGAWAGNGWVMYNGPSCKGVGFASTHPALKDRFTKFAQTLVPDLSRKDYSSEHTFRGYDCYSEKIHLNSTKLGHVMVNYGLTCREAHDKFLPPSFINASREFHLGLLAGLLDTDGSISQVKAKAKNKPQWMINYTTVSKHLVDDVCTLLTLLRIKSGVTPDTKRNAYTITISMPDLVQIAPELHLANPDKIARLKQLCSDFDPESPNTLRGDVIPVPKEYAQFLSQQIGSPKKKDTPEKLAANCLYMSLRNTVKHGTLTRSMFKRIVDRFGMDFIQETCDPAWLKHVLNENILWDFVERAEKLPGRRTAWDLTVPGSNTFMTSNQILVYDTLQIHVPATDAAMKEMRSLTMSNLLFGDKTRSDLMVFPQHEAILGVHLATQPSGPGAKTHTFKTKEEAMEAYHRGEVGLTDIIHLG
jgi:DNA-directed RNA polymerase beta subunit